MTAQPFPPGQFLGMVARILGSMMPKHDSFEAHCMLVAIAGQESGWRERVQTPVGWARGFWQCEKNGAVQAVLTRDTTRDQIGNVCDALRIGKGLDTVYEAIAWNDQLACCLARLNLLLDPAPLPAVGDRDGAWACYERVWRPGTPRPDSWQAIYDATVSAMSDRVGNSMTTGTAVNAAASTVTSAGA